MLGLVKINKRTAKKLFEVGETIYMLPNKVRKNNPWILPHAINRLCYGGDSFESIVNAYRYYSCNMELGNTVKFYLCAAEYPHP